MIIKLKNKPKLRKNMSKNSTIEFAFSFVGLYLFYSSLSKLGGGLSMLFLPIALASAWLFWEAGSDFLDKK